MIAAFEKSTGITIPYKLCERRSGDVDELWADISKATNKLNWKPKRNLNDMCAHSWKWQSKNPMGYRTQASVHLNNTNQQSWLSDAKTNDILLPKGLVESLSRKGKHFSQEVNNNDEDVAAFE